MSAPYRTPEPPASPAAFTDEDARVAWRRVNKIRRADVVRALAPAQLVIAYLFLPWYLWTVVIVFAGLSLQLAEEWLRDHPVKF